MAPHGSSARTVSLLLSKQTGEITMTIKKETLIRMPDVLKRTGFCRAWIYQLIHQKRFPEPVKIGERAIAFVESEIDEWIESTINISRNRIV